MRSKVLALFCTVVFTMCCPIIKPDGSNINLNVEVRTTDNQIAGSENCDGWIRIVEPSHTNPKVKYTWSHDKKHTTYEANDLCPGLYKITITDGKYKKIKQVIIN